MKTLILPASAPDTVKMAAEFLLMGELVAIPTETVYGLGANGLNDRAVKKVFEAKDRPQDNPLILHVARAEDLAGICENIPEAAWTLTSALWPGPLTLVLPCRDTVPRRTTAGLQTVAVRCPDHPVTRAIIQTAGVPIAAPSANRSGRPSCTTAKHVLEDMDGRIAAIVDGGDCAVGVESTILDLTGDRPRLLRPGGMPLETIQGLIGPVEVDSAVVRPMAAGEIPKAPGMKYRHYAPRAPVTVVKGPGPVSAEYISRHAGPESGVLCFSEYAGLFGGCTVVTFGSVTDPADQARRVFDALRAFDSADVTEIWAQCPPQTGLGLAVANRLTKAAGFHCIDLSEEGDQA